MVLPCCWPTQMRIRLARPRQIRIRFARIPRGSGRRCTKCATGDPRTGRVNAGSREYRPRQPPGSRWRASGFRSGISGWCAVHRPCSLQRRYARLQRSGTLSGRQQLAVLPGPGSMRIDALPAIVRTLHWDQRDQTGVERRACNRGEAKSRKARSLSGRRRWPACTRLTGMAAGSNDCRRICSCPDTRAVSTW